MGLPAPILQLEEHVVHRIAAGEVIQRPSSALKELIENSIDAGATRITITVKEGGLKYLQIQDDGSGIRHDDLPILCHRHTTSKLRQFEDLETIGTLGFRGEALASISFVAHISVVTMTRSTQHGWRVEYRDSQVVPPGPKPVAAVHGTTITVEDMFYNVPARRKAFKAGLEEYNLVKALVQRYAVYCAPGVSFTLKRQGEARSDLSTPAAASRLDVIRSLFGAEVSGKLLPIELQAGGSVGPEVGLDGGMRLRLAGYISNLTYVGRRTSLILFINGRPVEHGQLKRALEAMYGAHNPKAAKPWVFFDLQLPPRHVEVNMHPTKKEVGFLHQDDVIEAICQQVEAVLLAASSARTFAVTRLPLSSQLPDNGQQTQQQQQQTQGSATPGSKGSPVEAGATPAAAEDEQQQTQQPGSATPASLGTQLKRRSSSSGSQMVQLQLGDARPAAAATPASRPERLVRMDPRMQTLDSFLVPRAPGTNSTGAGTAAAGGGGGGGIMAARRSSSAAAAAAGVAAPTRKRRASEAGLSLGGLLPEDAEEALDLGGFSSTQLALSAQAAAAAQGAGGPSRLAASQPPSAAAGSGLPMGRQARLRPAAVVTQLTSILELVQEVEQQQHDGLVEMWKDHVWVGMADPTLLLLQHQTKLYLVDLIDATTDLFYQLTLRGWEAHQQLCLEPPLPVRDLLLAALGAEQAAGREQLAPGTSLEQVVTETTQLLSEKAAMLSEYLSMVFDQEGQLLTAVPLLLEGYTPDLARLPALLLALVRDVDWSEEQACFKGLAQVLAQFYAVHPLLPVVDMAAGSDAAKVSGGAAAAVSNQQPHPPQHQGEQLAQPAPQQPQQQQEAAVSVEAVPTELDVAALEADEQQLMADDVSGGSAAAGGGAKSERPIVAGSMLTAAADDADDACRSSKQQQGDPLAAHRHAEQRGWVVRHVLCRGLRWLYKPPQQRARDGSVLLLTSMERLYKVFERCR